MAQKLASELATGDRVLMEDGQVRVVAKVGKGFVKYRAADGTTKPSLMIDWRDGEWSQVPRDEVCELADR